MKRPKQHKIDSRAQKIFSSNCPDNWSKSKLSNDYGIDYFVQVFEDDDDGESTKISFIIQLKGTENYNQTDNNVKFPMKVDTLKYYFNKVSIPVFLVVVDVISEDLCWLFLQRYINDELEINNPSWKSKKTVTLYLPKANNFSNPKIIEKCAHEGSSYCNLLVNGFPTQEVKWKVKNIIDSPLDKSNDIKNEYSKLYDAQTRVGFELMHKENNPSEAKKSFQSVYDKTNGDEDNVSAHLNSIAGLIPFYEWQNEDDVNQLFEYIEEGFNLAKKNKIRHYEYYFYGCYLEKSCFILQEQLNRLLLIQKISSMGRNNALLNLMEITSNEETSSIFKPIFECYDLFSKNLMKTLDDMELFIFVELLRMLIAMQIHHSKVMYNFVDKNDSNSFFDHIKKLIDIFEDIISFSDDFSIFVYDLFTFKVMYYYFIEDNKYVEVIDEFIEYAEVNNSKYFIERANSLKERLSIPLKREKEISEMSDSEIHGLFKTLILTIEGIDIDKDESDEAFILKTAVDDLNPKRILDNCCNLELAYSSGGLYSRFFGLYTDGFKMLYCQYGGIKSNRSLDKAYEEFYKDYCVDCEHKCEQDVRWNPDKLSYIKSDKFKNILEKDFFNWFINE